MISAIVTIGGLANHVVVFAVRGRALASQNGDTENCNVCCYRFIKISPNVNLFTNLAVPLLSVGKATTTFHFSIYILNL